MAGGGGGYVVVLFTIEEQKRVGYGAMNSCATHACLLMMSQTQTA